MKSRINNELLTATGAINSNIPRNNPDAPILTDIHTQTSFLPGGVTLPERVYCIMNDLHHRQLCHGEDCIAPIKFHGMTKGYALFCSSKCRANDKKQIELRTHSIQEKYGEGVTNVFQAESIKVKIKNTVNERYGVNNIMQADGFARTHDYTNIGSKVVSDYINDNLSLNELVIKYNIGKPKLREILTDHGIDVKSHGKLTVGAIATLNDPDALKGLYTEYGSAQVIAGELGVTNACVLRYMKLHCIDITPKWDLSKYYGDDVFARLTDVDWMREQYDQTGAMSMADELGVSHETILNYLRLAGVEIKLGTKISYEERKLTKFIESVYSGEIVTNTKGIIYPYELDIYLPELKLAIEVNGVYWHSQIAGGKGRLYHQNKYELCRQQGIELVQLWDIEINNNFKVIESFILNKIGDSVRVFARKCEVRELNTFDEHEFMNDSHLQGYKSSKYAYGLYHNDVLMAAMTFGMPRFLGALSYDYELVRYAVKRGYSVIGGASKLLKAFTRSVGQCRIVSYSDCRYSQGNLYETLGFNLTAISDPIYYYTKGYRVLENRMGYQKARIKAKFPDQFDVELSEWENMKQLGYDRVWGCKTYTWVL